MADRLKDKVALVTALVVDGGITLGIG